MGFQKKEEILAYVGGKVLAFGATGSGKSTFAGTFPNINLVDSEDGNTYYLESNPNIIGVMRTTSASEVQETLDDLPEDIRELIELNVITEEEALSKCAIGGNKEKRMLIKRPLITFEGEGETKVPILAINKDKYKESDLVFLSQFIEVEEEKEEETEDLEESVAKFEKELDKKEEDVEDESSVPKDDEEWMKLLND